MEDYRPNVRKSPIDGEICLLFGAECVHSDDVKKTVDPTKPPKFNGFSMNSADQYLSAIKEGLVEKFEPPLLQTVLVLWLGGQIDSRWGL